MGIQISGLTLKATPVGTDEIEIQETGGATSKKTDLSGVKSYITGQVNTWSETQKFTGLLNIETTVPRLQFLESDGAADNQIWDHLVEGGQYRARIRNDAFSVTTNWLLVDRTGTAVDSVNFPSGTLQYGGVEVAKSDGTTGGTGSAGAGNQFVQLVIGGTTYKVLHDGTV